MLFRRYLGDYLIGRYKPIGETGQSPADDNLYIIAGQSNAVGQADYSGTVGSPVLPLTFAQDSSEAYQTPLAAVQHTTHVAQSLSDPIVWFDVARRSLQPYAAAGAVNMGIELSAGRVLNAFGPPCETSTMGIFASDLQLHWLPSSTYPTSPGGGPNLFTQFVTYIQGRIAASGKKLGGIFWIQGEGDALDSTRANAYAANLTTFVNALRAIFGNFTFVFNRISSKGTQPFNSVVRAQQAAYAAADSNSVLVNSDDLVLPGNLHFDARDFQTLGERMAMAMLRKRHPVANSTPGTPTYVGAGPTRIKFNANDTIVRWPGQVVDGDIGILVTMGSKGNFAVTAPTVPAGFTLASSAHSTDGTDHVFIAVYWCRVTQAVLDANLQQMPSVTLNNTNFDNAGRIFVFRGCTASGNPIDAFQGSTPSTYTTAVSATGPTTTVNNTLIAAFLGGHVLSASNNKLTSVANAGIPGMTLQRSSQETSGGQSGTNYQMLSLATGIQPTPGLVSATTATYPLNTLAANMVIALKGA